MGLKVFLTDFRSFTEEKTIRSDVDFIHFQNNVLVEKYYSFDQLFQLVKDNGVNIESLENDFYYVEIGNVTKNGDVEPVRLNFNEREKEDEDYYKKIKKGDIIRVQKGDILIAKVRPNLKKYVFIDEDNESYFYTSAFIHLRPKKMNKILYYSLRSIFYDNLIALSRQGKGYPTLKEDDIVCLKFDKELINKLSQKQDYLNDQIQMIEARIRELKKSIKLPNRIINGVFAREFGFDMEKFEELKKIKNFYLDLSCFGNNKDLRQSVKFHKEAGYFVLNQLNRVTNKKIKDFISEPIVLGASISPKDYDESGRYFYISMASIKNWQFESENAKLVSDGYAEQNQSRTVAKNDILLARSGEGTIGKVAIIEDEKLDGIFCDFVMRIRFKNYNPLFAYYYFRTNYFQYLIEINKKGLGNNTNIFPSQVQEFPIIDVPLDVQQRIVDQVKEELNMQEKIEKEIEDQRNKIAEIIKNVIYKEGNQEQTSIVG
ncbi:restriction endonuclease subunit S [Carboxydocella sp. ULO1]|uniref:restriction endonuclease subunit S n=1 Tax=Carboxydocella sp. ULO1 TaxID=1926599 RepID=UPI0009C612D4|nr:restriction endonuclease subunit S [Carboxydocella sp. ULO1]GAW27812.1 EcoKI restriction-modification system protein HsdS [Carboxydocella sp. ULO1]